MRKYDAARIQLLSVEALRALKRFMSSRELLALFEEGGLKLSSVDMSRYVTGSVLPRPGRALDMLRLLAVKNVLGEVLARAVVVDERGVVNVARVAYDMDVLRLAAARAFIEFLNLGIEKVLTAAVNGVPLAVAVAGALGADLCVARQEADASASSYVEVKYFAPDPPRYAHLYMPSFMLSKGDRVLVVDDLLQSGRTLRALVRIATARRAVVVAIFSLLAIGDVWRGSIPPSTVRVVIGKRIER